jgi:hypothetical protein
VTAVTYRVPADVMTAHLKGEAVILHLGTKAYFQMNDTAAELWRGLEAGEDEAAIVARLTAAFQVPAEQARPEVRRIIGELLARGLLAE